MKHPLRSLLLAASVSGLALAPMAFGVVALMPDTAAAQGASGNAGGGNAGGGDRGRSGDAPGQSGDRGASASAASNSGGSAAASNAGGRGALASELGGLNAANASPQALANAAPNSQVGRIATYRDASLAAAESGEAYAALEAELNEEILALEAQLDGRTSEELEAQLATLMDDEEATDEEIAALQAELDEVRALEDSVIALDEELAEAGQEYFALIDSAEDALLAASNGQTLSPEARAELHSLLGL